MFGFVLMAAVQLAGPNDWHGNLGLGRGGYWRNRAAVSVTNVSDKALEVRAEKGCGEARSLLDAYRAPVPMPNAGGRHSTKILPDPEGLESLRLRVGRLLSSGR